MTSNHHGRSMEEPTVTAGSVKRARQMAEASLQPGIPDENVPSLPRVGLSKAGLAARQLIPASSLVKKSYREAYPVNYDGGAGRTISRPTQVPQWPLPGTLRPSGKPAATASYRPPPGRSPHAPMRPPRPSRIPSMVDQTKMQEATPLFLTPAQSSSTYEQLSSMPGNGLAENDSIYVNGDQYDSVSDLPLSSNRGQLGAAKRGFNHSLPSSKRHGPSSHCSNTSHISPIVEEYQTAKSHDSYASSAAMPGAWRARSGGASSYLDAFYEESVTDKSRDSLYDEYEDESNLMPPRETTMNAPASPLPRSHVPSIEQYSFNGASATSSNTTPIFKQTPETTLEPLHTVGVSPEHIPKAHATAASTEPIEAARSHNDVGSQTPLNYRSSALKRPPRLDMDAVRAAESRGSLTSLPDLIRRATKLAAMIEKGRRPASRLDDLTGLFNEKRDNFSGQDQGDPYRSGFSDLLAAFPPPVQTPLNNGPNRVSCLQRNAWPLAGEQTSQAQEKEKTKASTRRRCCGIPFWLLVMVIILLLCAIVAAIVIPLEFFVFKVQNRNTNSGDISGCQQELVCLNGGTNIISEGKCSCICTNGFTGLDCRSDGSPGCITTDFPATKADSEINNATMGKLIPRLIKEANANFSLPISATRVLAQFDANNLSCIAQNALVTLNDLSTRDGQDVNGNHKQEVQILAKHITRHAHFYKRALLHKPGSVLSAEHRGIRDATSLSRDAAKTKRIDEASDFIITDRVLDFSRVAVLFILQKENLDEAQAAQTALQGFFTSVTHGALTHDNQVLRGDATNITIGLTNSVNLVDLTIYLGG